MAAKKTTAKKTAKKSDKFGGKQAKPFGSKDDEKKGK